MSGNRIESESKPSQIPNPQSQVETETKIKCNTIWSTGGGHAFTRPGRPFCVFDKFVAACPGPDHVLIVQKRRQQNVSLLSTVDWRLP